METEPAPAPEPPAESANDAILAEEEANRASREMDDACVPEPARPRPSLPVAAPLEPRRRMTRAFWNAVHRIRRYDTRSLSAARSPPSPPLPFPLRFRANRYDSDENVPPAITATRRSSARRRAISASARGGGRASGGGRRRRLPGSSRAPVGSLESLYDTFLAFANYGVRGGETTDTMDGAKWAKFCRESGLQNRRSLGPVQVDIIFSKVKRKGERRIAFEEFKDAVAMVAEMRKQTFTDVCMLIVTRGGPQSHGTRAEYVKFADPSNFTGAYAANLGMASKGRHKADASWKRKMPRIEPSDDLRRVFSVFNAFGGGNPSFMEGKTFIKLLRDCGLIDGQVRDARGRRFTPTAADLIFTKVKPKGERVIEMDDFVLALQLVADECGAPYEYVHDFVCGVDEPSNNGGTVGEYNKFYDDKDLYTGAYAAQFGVQKRPRAHREWREDRKRSSATPFSSATMSSMYRKSSYVRSFCPSATLAKMISADVIVNLRVISPVSFTSFAHDLMFMSTPLPPPKEQNAR